MVFWIGKLNAWDAHATDSLNCKGYSGVGSDGEYIYYTPFHNGSAFHGVVLRQKIYSIFKEAGTWAAYNAGAVDGLTSTGFKGNPIFDGRFMYFTPSNNGAVSGVVLRLDTLAPFKTAGSWAAYNAGGIDSLTCKGFSGGVFDGRYIYFVPENNGSADGVFLRYDTLAPFKSATSWTAYDAGSLASGAAKGYSGGVVVENFIYFSPAVNTSAAHGQILRLDLTQPFKSSGSWAVFNAATVSANCKGLGAPCFDGKFVYFPNATYNLILRYDPDKPFTSSSSYATFDRDSLSANEETHPAACVQGHYVAFCPDSATILVYDNELPFSDSGSWCEQEIGSADGLNIWGCLDCYSDPNYVYLAPYRQWADIGTSVHGTVIRARINPCPAQVFPVPGVEDLSKYIEDDSGNFLSKSSSRVTAASLDGTVALLYQDYNKDCFNGFEIWFDVRLNSASSYSERDDWGDFCTFSLGNRHSIYSGFSDYDDPVVLFDVNWDEDGVPCGQYIWFKSMGSQGQYYPINFNTIYYCKLTRSAGSSTITLRVYSNAARTTLLATLTDSTFPTSKKYRYIYAMRGADPGESVATFYLENLEVKSL